MTPQTVNAYYDPSNNTINFPAAILQPPFFDAEGDDAINYGGIGAVIGHESSHGFDDQGSQFDGDGNNEQLVDQGRTRRSSRRAPASWCEQFNAYAPIKDKPDLHVNGKLTLGENIADLGGLNVGLRRTADRAEEEPGRKPTRRSTAIPRTSASSSTGPASGVAASARSSRCCSSTPIRMHRWRCAPSAHRRTCRPSPARSSARPGDAMVRPADKQVKIW